MDVESDEKDLDFEISSDDENYNLFELFDFVMIILFILDK